MIKAAFKKILLKAAALPRADQRWILQQLTPEQQQMFQQHQGALLLKEAQRFARLSIPESNSTPAPPLLPTLSQELKQQTPLYAAIILDQGQFSWETMFLKEEPQIKELLHGPVQKLKTATKRFVFDQWQQELDFETQLTSGVYGNEA